VLAGYITHVTHGLTLSRPRPLLRDAAALWRAHPRGTIGIGLFGAILAAAIASASLTPHSRAPAAAPPAPPAMVVRPLAPDQALKINAEIPVTAGPNPAAAPFRFTGAAAARAQALNCLASAVYYEAGNQDVDGERAVAQVVLNRVRHPAFPASVCGVVYQGSTRPTGCQFTFTCDGSLNREPDAVGWRRATAVAEAALRGAVYAPVGWATHYHADYVVPYWAATMAKNTIIGAHLFYRWPGGWGQPDAFTKAYGGIEPSASALRLAALATVHAIAQQPGSLAAAIEKIPGAEPLQLSPSMRGDKRVAVRFNLVARKASAEVKAEDYSRKFASSDNLKWSLSGDTVAANQQPLGRPASATAAPGGASGAR
jgi:spore germination cell wall hydrolase CwlJ-like protein